MSRLTPILLDTAAVVLAAEHGHEIDMSDPFQNVEQQVGTPVDQLRLAIQTIETEMRSDGAIITEDDVAAAKQAIDQLRRIIDRIETKLAGYSAEHREKQRSDRADP